jgi:hypothetical protein
MINLQELKSKLSYNHETGLFTWLVYKQDKNKIGTIAGTYKGSDKYVRIHFNYKQYFAHRLAWFYYYGEMPNMEIDHIDGNRQNNKITNLRLCTKSQNSQNQRNAKPINSTGYLGVSYIKDSNKYRARIFIDKKCKNLGDYKTPEQAHLVYLQAKRKFHEFCTI